MHWFYYYIIIMVWALNMNTLVHWQNQDASHDTKNLNKLFFNFLIKVSAVDNGNVPGGNVNWTHLSNNCFFVVHCGMPPPGMFPLRTTSNFIKKLKNNLVRFLCHAMRLDFVNAQVRSCFMPTLELLNNNKTCALWYTTSQCISTIHCMRCTLWINKVHWV